MCWFNLSLDKIQQYKLNIIRYKLNGQSKSKQETIDVNVLSTYVNSFNETISNFNHYGDAILRKTNMWMMSSSKSNTVMYFDNKGNTEVNLYFKQDYKAIKRTFDVKFSKNVSAFGIDNYQNMIALLIFMILCVTCGLKFGRYLRRKIRE